MAQTVPKVFDGNSAIYYATNNTTNSTVKCENGKLVVEGFNTHEAFLGGSGIYAAVESHCKSRNNPSLRVSTLYTAGTTPVAETTYQFRTATSNNTVTEVARFQLNQTGIMSLEGKVITFGKGASTGVVGGARYDFQASYVYVNLGIRDVFGSPIVTTTFEDNVNWDVTFSFIGTTGVALNVQGDTNQNCVWHSTVKKSEIFV